MEREAILESKIEVLTDKIASLELELKVVKIARYVENDIMQTNFTRCKQAAEHWKEKYQEVCKCKDCPFCGQRQCVREKREKPKISDHARYPEWK